LNRDLKKGLVSGKLNSSGLGLANDASLSFEILYRDGGRSYSALFTGDAPGLQIASGLKSCKESLNSSYNEDLEMFVFSYMDIPHHGSSSNNSSELFGIALAKKYGYSYDGEKYCGKNADCKSPMCNMETINALKQAHRLRNTLKLRFFLLGNCFRFI
jgi:hypothetical protein